HIAARCAGKRIASQFVKGASHLLFLARQEWNYASLKFLKDGQVRFAPLPVPAPPERLATGQGGCITAGLCRIPKNKPLSDVDGTSLDPDAGTRVSGFELRFAPFTPDALSPPHEVVSA
ncbi:hypothetical protein, partial [Streptomyces sp. NBC_00344]|uniref:hypothetical protein n=1 Tax=Streptomyces sp. NBC_00344 TaxID=2975720 RepID=UPI002E1DE98A